MEGSSETENQIHGEPSHAVKDHILADGQIDAEKAAWLRQMVFADDKIDDQERKLLHELDGEAKQVSPEFKLLLWKA